MAKERKGVLTYKYLSTLRPVSIGTYPIPKDNRIVEIKNFGARISLSGVELPGWRVEGWGWIEYEKRLPAELAKQYDLVEIRIMI